VADLNRSQSRRGAAGLAPVLPPQTIAQPLCSEKLLQCGILDPAYDRGGSIASLRRYPRDVPFCAVSGHHQRDRSGPKSAMKRLWMRYCP
jgi:hypothetical protein